MEAIYLDYNASTPIAPEVTEAMRQLLDTAYGNPSSSHWAGAPAQQALQTARQQVATLLGCSAAEIVFTSGGSEANNQALKGVFYARRDRGEHIITSQIEHPAVLAPCRFLQSLGADVTYLPVDASGRVNPEEVRRAITERTILVSIMHANNEVGSLQPIAEIAKITRAHDVLLHTDAAQSAGKIATKVDQLGVDLLSLAGHKLYAPKGVGALYIRQGIALAPLIHGADHESGRRAGTESALLTVGLGQACETAHDWIESSQILQLRDRLWRDLRAAFGDHVLLNGHPQQRLPNTLNVSLLGQIGAEVLAELPELAASTGSACHAGQHEPSPVLTAMGLAPEVALGAIRLSLGRATTASEIEQLVVRLQQVVKL